MAKPAKAVAAVDEVDEPKQQDVRLIEVQLLRKYVPHLCYDEEDGKFVPRPNESEADNFPYQKQNKVVIGTTVDRRGNDVPRYREVNDVLHSGSVVLLPVDEAQRAIKLGIATVTERSFA